MPTKRDDTNDDRRWPRVRLKSLPLLRRSCWPSHVDLAFGERRSDWWNGWRRGFRGQNTGNGLWPDGRTSKLPSLRDRYACCGSVQETKEYIEVEGAVFGSTRDASTPCLEESRLRMLLRKHWSLVRTLAHQSVLCVKKRIILSPECLHVGEGVSVSA